MGIAKEMMADSDAALRIAVKLGVEIDYFEECEAHGLHWVVGGDKRDLYKRVQSAINRGEPIVSRLPRETLLEGVQAAIDDSCIDSCAHCDSIRAKD